MPAARIRGASLTEAGPQQSFMEQTSAL